MKKSNSWNTRKTGSDQVKKTLAHIAEWLHIEEKIDENPVITGVSINTRTIQPGDLFIPFRGEQVNGHRFVQDAFVILVQVVPF